MYVKTTSFLTGCPIFHARLAQINLTADRRERVMGYSVYSHAKPTHVCKDNFQDHFLQRERERELGIYKRKILRNKERKHAFYQEKKKENTLQ